MTDALLIGALVVLNLYVSWRYAKTPAESDFGIFATWGMTGAAYGRDFVDCKTPLVHAWLALLAKVKRDFLTVRLLHFFTTGLPSIAYYVITKDFAGALAFLVMIHSGWLLTFHGNVGDIPAGLILLALISGNAWIVVGLLVLATLYEPKLIIATGLMVLVKYQTLLVPALVYSGMVVSALMLLRYEKREVFDWLVESSFTIPKRIQKSRKGLYPFMPGFTSTAFLYILPWLALAISARPDPLYWIPPIAFLAFQFSGKVVRQNHFIPLIAWIAAAGMKPEFVYALAATDFISSGLYLGDIWVRFYPGIASIVKDAKRVGEWMKNKPGSLWVNTMWAQIYAYSGKKPEHGMMEVVEVNTVADERRQLVNKKIITNPPIWIVTNGDASVEFDYKMYEMAARSPHFLVYKRRVQ
mgnify:FL=1